MFVFEAVDQLHGEYHALDGLETEHDYRTRQLAYLALAAVIDR